MSPSNSRDSSNRNAVNSAGARSNQQRMQSPVARTARQNYLAAGVILGSSAAIVGVINEVYSDRDRYIEKTCQTVGEPTARTLDLDDVFTGLKIHIAQGDTAGSPLTVSASSAKASSKFSIATADSVIADDAVVANPGKGIRYFRSNLCEANGQQRLLIQTQETSNQVPVESRVTLLITKDATHQTRAIDLVFSDGLFTSYDPLTTETTKRYGPSDVPKLPAPDRAQDPQVPRFFVSHETLEVAGPAKSAMPSREIGGLSLGF